MNLKEYKEIIATFLVILVASILLYVTKQSGKKKTRDKSNKNKKDNNNNGEFIDISNFDPGIIQTGFQFMVNQTKQINISNKINKELESKLYGLYMQSTIGDCNTQKPINNNGFEIVKWNEWNKLKGKSKLESQYEYTNLAQNILNNIK